MQVKTKLAYLCSSTSWGGLEMNHLRNAKWMLDRGHEILVIGIEDSPYHNYAKSLQLPFQAFPIYKKYYDFKAARSLVLILEENGISHLLIRSTRDMSIVATVKRKMKHRIHTSYFMEMQLGVKKTGIGHSIRFKYIDLWSCPLHWLHEQVQTMTHFKNELVIIPSGVNLSVFDSELTISEARKKLDLPTEGHFFGLIGRFDPQKGQLLLLQAIEKCKNTDFSIVLLGEPTKNEGEAYYAQMKFIAEKKEDRVIIRPYRSDIVTFYRAMNWIVMATKAETIGMVTIESLASGTPVLGSNAGGTPEILSEEKGGMLFESMNADDLADKIDEILSKNQKFEPATLQQLVRHFDHHSVCGSVEKTLGISHQ